MADFEEQITGSPETGYFRDPRARGLRSGRLSPRVPIRPPVRDRVAVRRGLVNPGDVDMNQGMLFHPSEIEQVPMEDISKREGIPLLRKSSSAGFLPGVEGSEGGKKTAADRKVRAIREFSEGLAIPNKTIAGSVAHAKSFMTGEKPENPWYEKGAAGAIETGTMQAAAEEQRQTGIPSHLTSAQFRRGVALFSAQRPWDTGNKQEGSYRVSNVENVIGLPAHVAQDKDPKEYTVPAVRGGFPVAGQRAKPQTGIVQEKAAEVLRGNVDPSSPHTSEGDKIPTFDTGLGMGMTRSQPMRRHISDAMVIDTHQARVSGLPDYDVVANKVGGYDVAALVNRRASLKAANEAMKLGLEPATPIESQEGSWQKIRASGPEPLGMMSLFQEDKKTGNLVPTDFEKVKKWSQGVTEQTTKGLPKKKKATKKPKGTKKKK